LAKIRNKFTQQKGLSGYQRKKYVWKLLYMYILGYEIDFGHFEAANLINSPKFSEKYTGYIATGILVSESDENIYKTIAQSIRIDLNSANEINSSLALAMVGALAPKELVEQLDKDIQRIAFSESR
jgi:AP-2 complex subunit alpha